jgi:hypothetical protein
MDVTHEDFNCPTIIDKKINATNSFKVNPRINSVPREMKICFQIRYSIKIPEKIEKRPTYKLALYSSVCIHVILITAEYFFKNLNIIETFQDY